MEKKGKEGVRKKIQAEIKNEECDKKTKGNQHDDRAIFCSFGSVQEILAPARVAEHVSDDE